MFHIFSVDGVAPSYVMVDTNSILPTGPPPVPPILWHVPLSLGLFAVSIFLLLQGIGFLKWVNADQKGAPNPKAGLGLAVGLTVAIFLFFFIPWFWSSFYHSYQDPVGALFMGPFSFPVKDPDKFSQALLLSSLPVGAIATFKFMTAAAMARSNDASFSTMPRSPLALLLAGLFSVLQLAGSVASILALFR